jgi:hypothetical protein
VLSDADAAATYGEPGTASAGPAVGTAGADPADVPAKQVTHGDEPTGQEPASARSDSAPLDDAATDPNLRPVRADETDTTASANTAPKTSGPIRRKTSPTDRER